MSSIKYVFGFFVATLLLLGTTTTAFAQLNISKSVNKTTVLAGETFVYTLQYRCANITSPCNNVSVTDVLPANLIYISSTGSVHTTATSGSVSGQAVTFTFINPLPAGSTGELTITCKFPNGLTHDGATATNTASITDGSAVVTSNAVTVTSHASNQFCPDLYLSSGGAIGAETRYTIPLSATNGQYSAPYGVLNPTNITVVQHLPVGAVFVSAGNLLRNACCGAAYNLPTVALNSIVGTYNAAARTITWIVPTGAVGVADGGLGYPHGLEIPLFLESTVRYESPAFQVGNAAPTTVDVTYTPIGTVTPLTLVGSPTGSGCAQNLEDNHILQAPNYSGIVTKGLSDYTGQPIIAGSSISYGMSWGNNGNVPLANVVVEDLIPSAIKLTSFTVPSHTNGSGVFYNIYYKSANSPVYTLHPASPFNAAAYYDFGPYGTYGNNLNLALTDYVTGVKLEFLNDLPPGFMSNQAYWYYTVNETLTPQTVNNCLTYTTTSPITGSQSACAPFTHNPRLTYAVPNPEKQYTVDPSFYAHWSPEPIGGVLWTRLAMQTYASAPMVNPVIMDLLPLGLTYDNAWQMPAPFNSANLPAPVFEHIPNYNGSGRELLRWRWTGTYATLDAGTQVFARVKVTNLAMPGVELKNVYALSSDNSRGCHRVSIYNPDNDLLKDTYDLDGDGSTTDSLCFNSVSGSSLVVNASAALESVKLVKGQVDNVWTKYPATGRTVPGGMADYRLKVQNVGNIPMKNIAVIDILPFVGDVGVLDPQTRLTEWRPNLAGIVSAAAGVTVYYSTESNPCRTELGYSPATCVAANWSATPPADITNVRSLKFDFGATIIQPGDSLVLTWPMRAPVTAPYAGEIAWNSFAYIGTRTDNNTPLLASEPIKVGIKMQALDPAVYGDKVWLDANGNGIQDEATGYDGVRVTLYKDDGDGIREPGADDAEVSFTVSANGGLYIFPNLTAGDYFAVFSNLPAGYTMTRANQGGNPALDSDGTPFGAGSFITPITHLVTTEDDRTWDFGIALASSLGNYVWNDLNNDGINNEPASAGINGVTVKLYKEDGAGNFVFQTAMLTANNAGNPGYYNFTGLAAGNYKVQFVAPSGKNFGKQNQTPNTDNNSDADGIGWSAAIALAAGETNNTIDAGFITACTMGRVLYFCGNQKPADADAFDHGMIGYLTSLGNTITPALTQNVAGLGLFNPMTMAPTGITNFNDFDAIIISSTVETSYSAALADSLRHTRLPVYNSNLFMNTDINISSNAYYDNTNSAYSGTTVVPITQYASVNPTGGASYVYSADYYSNAHVSLWLNATAFTNQNRGVLYYYNSNDALPNPTMATPLNNHGRRVFFGLDFNSIYANPTNGGALPSPASAWFNPYVHLTADGKRYLDSALTLMCDVPAPIASVGNYAWNDINKNGLNDEPTSAGINGLTVELYQDNGSGTFNLIATTTTANDGAGNAGYYNFAGLGSWNYYVKFPTASGTYTLTTQTPTAATNNNSDANTATGQSPIFALNASGTGVLKNNMTIDAGYVCTTIVNITAACNGANTMLTANITPVGTATYVWNTNALTQNITISSAGGYTVTLTDASGCKVSATIEAVMLPCAALIGDHVWNDADKDGIQGGSETPIPNVKVYLYDKNDLTLAIDSTQTNLTTGNYQFTILRAGDYAVRFQDLAGWTRTKTTANTADGSDAIQATGWVASITVVLGTNNMALDAGYYATTLPVKMLYFNGSARECTVSVKWATATELNSQQFTVERSADGFNWAALGTVKSAGTTNIAQYYEYKDEKPLRTNYYRLVQMDFDGNTETFNLNTQIDAKDCYGDTNNGISDIYPNPISSGELSLKFFTDHAGSEKLEFVLYDILGKKIASYPQTVTQGASALKLDISDLPSGTYMLHVIGNDWYSIAQKLVKL
jgi:uncharacterized repeat protein (TIGR01451 family)